LPAFLAFSTISLTQKIWFDLGLSTFRYCEKKQGFMNLSHSKRLATHQSMSLPLMGLAELTTKAFQGVALGEIEFGLTLRLLENPFDAEALMDLSTLSLLQGKRAEHNIFQKQALAVKRVFRQFTGVKPHAIRILSIMVAGDFLANTPIEFLLNDFDVTLEKLFLVAGEGLPDYWPEHDIVFVAVGESEENLAILDELGHRLKKWPKPVLNRPAGIKKLIRDGAYEVLRDVAGSFMPVNRRIGRTDFMLVAVGEKSISPFTESPFPIIARPVDSHAGIGLQRLENPEAVADYLRKQGEDEFFVSPFIDYRSSDGWFRKYRIALIDGIAFPVHMAVSKRWMVHYLNADMIDNAANRGEEAQFMLFFGGGFGLRHAQALARINELLELDYVLLDCGEMPDGRLLIFEAGNAMIVHAMDPEALFPHKAPTIRMLFEAFHRMLDRHSQEPGCTPELSLVGG
jgi:hypothetical protein